MKLDGDLRRKLEILATIVGVTAILVAAITVAHWIWTRGR